MASPLTATGRYIVVDGMGLLLAVPVTAADVYDTKAAVAFARLEGQPVGKVGQAYPDSKYHDFAPYEWVSVSARWDLAFLATGRAVVTL